MGVNPRPRSLRRMISNSFGSSFGSDRKDDETASSGAPKSVSFNEAYDQVYTIDALELSLEEKRELWYTKTEFNILLEESKTVSSELFKTDSRAKTLRRLFLGDFQSAEDIEQQHKIVPLQEDIVGLQGYLVPNGNRKRLVKQFQVTAARFPRNGTKRENQISLISAKESSAPRLYARYCALASWKAETEQQ
mmetsp:Transcript_16679/g.33652  ORF Transcript_16679/g.33652 Transcript_16679/m.33652 type:complete len:192 (+) Transcript_16679:115-690(+)|eukprot:scaffold5540_cov181-Amphora_coffeaeformis.AAC.1